MKQQKGEKMKRWVWGLLGESFSTAVRMQQSGDFDIRSFSRATKKDAMKDAEEFVKLKDLSGYYLHEITVVSKRKKLSRVKK